MDGLHFKRFVEWAFYGIISGTCVYGVSILGKMNDNINTLNVQVATIIASNGWQEKTNQQQDTKLNDLEKRILTLELGRHK